MQSLSLIFYVFLFLAILFSVMAIYARRQRMKERATLSPKAQKIENEAALPKPVKGRNSSISHPSSARARAKNLK